MCHVRGFFKLVVLMLSVTLVGCASSLARIDTWQGENGREMTNFRPGTVPGLCISV